MLSAIALFGPPLVAVGLYQYLSTETLPRRSLLFVYGFFTVAINAVLQLTPWRDLSAEAVKENFFGWSTYCGLGTAFALAGSIGLRMVQVRLSVKVENAE